MDYFSHFGLFWTHFFDGFERQISPFWHLLKPLFDGFGRQIGKFLDNFFSFLVSFWRTFLTVLVDKLANFCTIFSHFRLFWIHFFDGFERQIGKFLGRFCLLLDDFGLNFWRFWMTNWEIFGRFFLNFGLFWTNFLTVEWQISQFWPLLDSIFWWFG